MFKSIKAWFNRRHSWAYRNPYDRTCKVCDRNEVEHYRGVPSNSWWEVFRIGVPDKPCSKKDS